MTDKRSQTTIVLGIAGGSGGGKSTLARAIYEELGKAANVTYLIHDHYYKHAPNLTLEERAGCNYDHPDSLETDLLVKHIRELKEGKCAQIPNYDFTKHLRKPDYTTVESKSIILVEGILLFENEDLLKEIDVKVFVDSDSDIRLMRRITRDVSERGRTSGEVIDQYSAYVRPMHLKFVEPSKKCADIIVSGEGSSSVALKMITTYLRCKANARS